MANTYKEECCWTGQINIIITQECLTQLPTSGEAITRCHSSFLLHNVAPMGTSMSINMH